MRLRYGWFALGVATILAFMVSAAACSSGGGGGGGQVMSGNINVEAGEYYFKPTDITVKAGSPVTFVVHNAGKILHNLSITELNKATPNIDPGGTQNLQITFDKTGTYNFLCTVPGHADSGMKGKITVVQ